MTTYCWAFDEVADVNYNIVGAFEVVLLNLGVVDMNNQWDLRYMETYSSTYGTKGHKYGNYCRETGGSIYSDEEFRKKYGDLIDKAERLRIKL